MPATLKFGARVIASGRSITLALALLSLSCWVPLPAEGCAQPATTPVPTVTRIDPVLAQRVQGMTVKLWTGHLWGSGILIQRQQGRYAVLTNAHTINGSDRFIVETIDGRRYPATLSTVVGFARNDLALVTFNSPQAYPIAQFSADPELPPPGTPVIAAGFPIDFEHPEESKFVLTTGQISGLTPKPLDGGYRIGYTNDIAKGMSGGPVLNLQGEVIAVNGMHAEPLWGNPYEYADGSLPSPELYPLLFNSSWGIPVKTVRDFWPPAVRPILLN
jgi:S1-C subfamily serine protease